MEYLIVEGKEKYPLIRPLVGFKESMQSQVQRFPFSKNVFLMMKFRDSNRLLSDFILEELKDHGFLGVRADQPEWNITRNTYNPIAALYCCKFGLVLFDEPEIGQAYSPNVAYELGMMHYQDKNCLILKHKDLPPVPFDLVKDIYQSYKSDIELRSIIARWIESLKNEAYHRAFTQEHYINNSENGNSEVPIAKSDPAMVVLQALAKLGEGVFSASEVANNSAIAIVRVRYFLNMLKELRYVDSGVIIGEKEVKYKLTEEGIKTLISNNFI